MYNAMTLSFSKIYNILSKIHLIVQSASSYWPTNWVSLDILLLQSTHQVFFWILDTFDLCRMNIILNRNPSDLVSPSIDWTTRHFWLNSSIL